MPEYAYKCNACDHRFSEVIPMREYKTRKKCPECKKHKLQRVIERTSGFVHGEATTLGQLGEQNAKREAVRIKRLTKRRKFGIINLGAQPLPTSII